MEKVAPKFDEMFNSVAHVLSNYHPLLQSPKVTAPTKITSVGGFHLKTSEDQIHPEFLKTMDRAPNGIIYISSGSKTRLADFPLEKVETILSVLGSYEDILVLMKFESAGLKEKHNKNTIVGPWLPQQDILNHPKLKVFITLGGYLSVMEAVNYGKPIIAIPLEKSQESLVNHVVEKGVGIRIDYDELSPEILKKAIEEIYENPTFEENAKNYSNIFRYSKMNPLERISHIVNYTVVSNAMLNLKKFNLNLPELMIFEQDWFVMLLTIILTLLFTSKVACKFVMRRKHQQKKGKSQKKKIN